MKDTRIRASARPALSGIIAAALIGAASLLAGCTGISALGPKDYTDAIPSSLAKLAGKSDGTYRGSFTIAVPAGVFAAFRHFEVDVHVAAGAITAIDLVQPEVMKTADFFLELPARIVAKQSLDVDAVSGVTYSSKSFIKAVENALEN